MPSLVFAAVAAISFFFLAEWMRRRMMEAARHAQEDLAVKLLALRARSQPVVPRLPSGPRTPEFLPPEQVFRSLLAGVQHSDRQAGYPLHRLEWYQEGANDVISLRATPGGTSVEEGYGELVVELMLNRNADQVIMRTEREEARPVSRRLMEQIYLPRIVRRTTLVARMSSLAEAV